MKRTKWRLVILVLVLVGCVAYLIFGSGHYLPWIVESGPKPITFPGKNEVAAVRLLHVDSYSATVEVEYFYNGESGPYTRLQVAVEGLGSAGKGYQEGLAHVANPGRQKVAVYISRVVGPPIDPQAFKAPLHTASVKARLSAASGSVLAEATFPLAIDWPSSDPFVLSGTSTTEVDRLYKLCVETIDRGQQLDLAKKGLEQIILANPDFVPAYAELARYHMKTNWSQDGLAQAEQSLKSALRVDPRHANSLVLIGYVYAHQRRFKEADDAFKNAESIGTRNIWLYANWGELRIMEGKQQAAMEMYKKAINAPQDLDTYERAREDAYEHLLGLLADQKNWQEADRLYKERITRYPGNGCFKASHAAFRLGRLGDYDSAIAIGTKALEQDCQDSGTDPRMILAMAYYTKWATVPGKKADARESDQLFSRGQALYSDMAPLFYSLAGSQYTAVAIPALQRRGIKIDTPDRDGVTALGYAIMNSDLVAVRTLIRSGANVNQDLNPDKLTPLMLAASRGNRPIVSFLLRAGADRRRKTNSGYSAERLAGERGFKDVASLISGRSGI